MFYEYVYDHIYMCVWQIFDKDCDALVAKGTSIDLK